MRICKCGCDKELETNESWIRGHKKLHNEMLRSKKRIDGLCRCGCKRKAETSTGWVKGHWNKNKIHANRKSPIPVSEESKKKMSVSQSKRWEGKKKPLNSCACGCGAMVKGKWSWGHHSRVNNISKRPDIKKRRSESMKERHRNGTMPEVWNSGLTKETDKRVAEYGISFSKSITVKERANRSVKMSNHRKDGTIPTLSGSSHSQWQGGTSSITQRIRGSHQLYENWKKPILESDRFKCVCCNKGSEEVQLAVHHLEERMASIIQKFIPEDKHELTWEEETDIVDLIVRYHLTDNVQGITLCYGCHELVHRIEKEENRILASEDIIFLKPDA